jgi:hypothetical protein
MYRLGGPNNVTFHENFMSWFHYFSFFHLKSLFIWNLQKTGYIQDITKINIISLKNLDNTEIKINLQLPTHFRVTQSEHFHVELLLYVMFYIVLVLNKCNVYKYKYKSS